MKKLTFLALTCTLIIITSCNQNSPAPSTPNTPSTTPTYSMTATETALVGDWIWDSTVNYIGGNIREVWTPNKWVSWGTVITNTLYAGSHMVLKSSIYSPLSPLQYYDADYYSIFQGGISQYWYITYSNSGNRLVTTGQANPYPNNGYIVNLNTTNLIVQEWVTGQIPNGTKAFYHK